MLPLSILGPVQQLILQLTNFCNMNCSYCYLPNRNDSHKMQAEVVKKALYRLRQADLLKDSLEVRWHAGEPLAVGTQYLSEVISALDTYAASIGIRIKHSLQTNGTLIDEDFCRLAHSKNINVGVSFDGPKALNDLNRITRTGNSTFKDVSRGIDKLNEFDVPFDIICVLTSRSLGHSEEIFTFFKNIGARSVGFNLEESEGVNSSSVYGSESLINDYKIFIRDIFSLSMHYRLKIREIDEMKRVIIGGNDSNIRHISNVSFGQVSIDSRGQLYTFSPELVGVKNDRFFSFDLGNIFNNTISEMVEKSRFQVLKAEIEQGVNDCKRTCSYFRICGGGSPSNKLGETGRFDTTETWHCRARYQALAEVVLDELEQA